MKYLEMYLEKVGDKAQPEAKAIIEYLESGINILSQNVTNVVDEFKNDLTNEVSFSFPKSDEPKEERLQWRKIPADYVVSSNEMLGESRLEPHVVNHFCNNGEDYYYVVVYESFENCNNITYQKEKHTKDSKKFTDLEEAKIWGETQYKKMINKSPSDDVNF